MVKLCPVIMANEYVTVVKYNDVIVQLPFIGSSKKFVSVNYKNGKYSVADDSDNNSSNAIFENNRKNKKNKKTAINEEVAEQPAADEGIQN